MRLTNNYEELAQMVPTYDAQFNFDYQGLNWETWTFGGGTYTKGAAKGLLNVGTASGDRVIRQIRRYLHWGPSHGYQALLSATFGPVQAGTVKRVGIYAPANGFYLQQDANGFSIVTRAANVDTVNPQSQWNIDPLDGSGITKPAVDLTKQFTLYIDYEMDKLSFGYANGGEINWAWETVFGGNTEMLIPGQRALPITFEILNTSNVAAPSTLELVYAASLQRGPYHIPPFELHSAVSPYVTLNNTTEKVMLCIRPALQNRNGYFSRVLVVPHTIEASVEHAPVLIRVYMIPAGTNTPITWDGTWVAAPATSEAQVNTTATVIPSGAILIASGFGAASPSTGAKALIEMRDDSRYVFIGSNRVVPDAAATSPPNIFPGYWSDCSALVITATAITPVPAYVNVAANWREELQ